ncbi:MAG: hypothetical protein JW894_04450 [Bacteroidales bacterium]|nr:hypothetical protein [Bacteroidales bacterium]
MIVFIREERLKFLLIILISVFLFTQCKNNLNDDAEKVKIKGKVMDASYVNIDGKEIVWFLSGTGKAYNDNNSKKPIKEPIWLNKYSMDEKKVVKKIKLDTDFFPHNMRLVQYNKKLFIFSSNAEDRYYYVINIISGDPVETITQFQQRSPKLSAGIAKLQYTDHGNLFNSCIDIMSRDGYSMIYSIAYDSLYSQRSDLETILKEKMTEFELVPENNAGAYDRKLLCKKKWEDVTYESHTYKEIEKGNWQMITEIVKTGSKREIKTVLDSNWVFLKGEILYQDMQCAIVVHEAGLGRELEDCQRFLTCMDTTGNVLWKINAVDKISEKLLRSDKGTSDIFFVKNHFSIKRVDSVFSIFYTPEEGVLYIMKCDTGDRIAKLVL